ncbi:sigma 54-interacting transcriptional regulator [uncultured Winogradskyella sp.]|uniref:sigma 54-interacting transcriptional regulator n=1 Tax=uncultured Winogradskyella sp. TaxID=395353 RepID=UPI00262F7A88|nr:sigma 54-interacting transcriptional regulator [uncultured Winogradskyella sp.]
MSTVLIVDDIYENLYLLRVILEKSGFDVIEAYDGKEGLEQLSKNRVDIIVSDILMPVMDGYMFCQACKKEEAYKSIPFLFYTSTYTEKLDEELALKLGAVKFLRKPTDYDKIVPIIQNVLKQEIVKPNKVVDEDFSEKEVLRFYSKRLISKLEQKNLELEKEILERKKIEKSLIQKNEILDLFASNIPLNKILEQLILNYESENLGYFGSINLVNKEGTHLKLSAGPSLPESYLEGVKIIKIEKDRGSCGTAAFAKQTVIVSDVATDKLWKNDKELALKHNLKSCWSVPVLSKDNELLGTFAIYSSAINAPTEEEIKDLNFAVGLAVIAIEKSIITEEIKKKDESYKALVNQAIDAIIAYDFEGNIYEFNRATYLMLGYTKNEFSNMKLQDFLVGNIIRDLDLHQDILDGKSVVFQRQLRHKNGNIIEGEVSVKIKGDGKVVSIVRDITEREKILRAIKQEKEFSSGLLEAMQEGLYAINTESEIISVNPAFCRMTGFSQEELLGVKRPYPFSPPELSEANDIRYKLLTENKNETSYENTYLRKNGERFPVQLIVSRINDADGNKIANFATIQDITERRKAEIELKLSKEFNDKLIMSMQEGLMIASLDTKLILVNDSLCKITGYTKTELLSHGHPYPFWKKQDHDSVLGRYQEVAEEKAKEVYYDIVKKNGEIIKASFFTGTIKNNKEEVIAVFATIKDISEEEKAKQLLIEKEKRSNQKKQVILELAELVGEDLELSLKRITELSAITLNVERVSIWSFSEDRSSVVCKNYYTLEKGYVNEKYELNYSENSNYFETLKRNQSILIKDARNNELTKPFAESYLIPNNIISLMDVSINSAIGSYGLICFAHSGENLRDWTAEEQEFATSIASIVSLMVESSERRHVEEELVLTNSELFKANNELNSLREKLERENIYLRNEIDLVFNYEEMVYGSEIFSNVLNEIEQVAPTNATVLLLGESGTGKELLARAIHNIGHRNNDPLIKVNCSAIPRELIESELFGHKKGSFTGAFSDKIGKFELADNGTLFLDEIGELPLDMQPKILRFLQEGEIEVVGGAHVKKLNVRVIAATNRNLVEEIRKKQFREDLYFRLNVFPINVPALRERKDDIPLLVEHFVEKFNKAYNKNIEFISDESMTKLKAYNWPGNIRELENLIERASILSSDKTLIIPGFESSSQKTKPINNIDLSLDAVQRNHILQILEQCNWKITGSNGAAELLELKPSTLRDRMAKLGLKRLV